MNDCKLNEPPTPGKRVAEAVEIISKVVGIVSIIIAGGWTYRQFNVERVDGQNLVVLVTPTVVAEGTGTPAIVIDISLKNIGKVPIKAGKLRDDKGNVTNEGCELTVIEYSDMSAGFVHGANNAPTSQSMIDWRFGGSERTYRVDHYNVLGDYDAFRNETYILNPGAEFHERAVASATPGHLYGIRARFFSSSEWTMADMAYVYVR